VNRLLIDTSIYSNALRGPPTGVSPRHRLDQSGRTAVRLCGRRPRARQPAAVGRVPRRTPGRHLQRHREHRRVLRHRAAGPAAGRHADPHQRHLDRRGGARERAQVVFARPALRRRAGVVAGAAKLALDVPRPPPADPWPSTRGYRLAEDDGLQDQNGRLCARSRCPGDGVSAAEGVTSGSRLGRAYPSALPSLGCFTPLQRYPELAMYSMTSP
jgi:hypothetical protein